MKLQKILNRLQKLHPKEIDLSLDRIKTLCEKLGNPQDKIKAISVVGTNGKQSTINALFQSLKEAQNLNVMFIQVLIFKELMRDLFLIIKNSDEELANLFEEIEKINDNQQITFFEILTACYFL